MRIWARARGQDSGLKARMSKAEGIAELTPHGAYYYLTA